MTITSRGAVAPTAAQAGTRSGRRAGAGRTGRHGCARCDRRRRRRQRHRVGQDRRRGAGRPAHAGDRRHHGGRRGLAGGRLCGQGAGPGHDGGGRGALRGRRHVRAHGSPVPRRVARHREGRQAVLRRPGPRSARRPAAGPGLPRRRLRPHHVPPDDRRGLDAARRHPGLARRRSGRRLRRPRRPRRHGARARRGQRGLARTPRRALQALRRGQGRRDEGQPGQRLPGAALEPRPGAPDRRAACCASSTAAPRSGDT